MGDRSNNMALVKGLVCALIVGAVIATIEEEWIEDNAQTLVEMPLELLDTTLSSIVPGVKRGSMEESVQSGQNHLSVQLDAVNPIIDLTNGDDEFHLAFTVFNPTEKDVKFCIRDTPLEGVQSKLFMVHNPEGKVMEYRGKDVKRDAVPSEDEYKIVKAGESISRRVRLSRRYQLDGDGLYYIRVRQPRDGHMQYTDIMRTQTTVFVKGTAEHEARDQQRQTDRETAAGGKGAKVPIIDKNGKVPIVDELADTTTIQFDSCSSSKQAELRNWHEDARGKIQRASACSTTSCSDAVDTWFGASTTQASFADNARSQFITMNSVLDNTQYKCQGASGPCSSGRTYAYVYPTDTTQKVYICDFTFNYPDYSEKVQTVIHELSHFNHIGNTNDNAYGESTCINLAQSNFQAAIQTADNVGYFGKYANSCYRNAPNGYTPKNSPLQGCVDQYSNCQELAASGCSSRVQGYCCQSCTGGAASDDCSGISAGAGGSTSTDTRRRATPAPAPTSTDTNSRDTAGNCASLKARYGCTACCVGGGGDVASVCAATCRTGSTTTTTPAASSGDDSCQYANDNVCDEPTYCRAGTDATDCA